MTSAWPLITLGKVLKKFSAYICDGVAKSFLKGYRLQSVGSRSVNDSDLKTE